MTDKFYKLPQSITARKDLKASDKIVYAVIVDHLGDNDKCWPGVQTLMSKTCGQLSGWNQLNFWMLLGGEMANQTTIKPVPKIDQYQK